MLDGVSCVLLRPPLNEHLTADLPTARLRKTRHLRLRGLVKSTKSTHGRQGFKEKQRWAYHGGAIWLQKGTKRKPGSEVKILN